MKKFELVDVNQYYYNCGHYPEYEIQEKEGKINAENTTRRGTPLEYDNLAQATEVCAKLNNASSDNWHRFLNG